MKLRSDKGFIDFLKDKGRSAKLLGLLLLGAILILLSLTGVGSKTEPAVTEEERVAEMCSQMEGVGQCRVMMTYRSDGQVYGVLVLCEGAESPACRERITSLFCSLYGIGAHRVEIQQLVN